MRYLISSPDSSHNFLRVKTEWPDGERTLGSAPLTYGAFSIRIDNAIDQPKTREELQALVSTLLQEACEARKAKRIADARNFLGNLSEGQKAILESRANATKVEAEWKGCTRCHVEPIAKEIDTLDPSEPEPGTLNLSLFPIEAIGQL